jgi:very-short-patch-repair endonuclease
MRRARPWRTDRARALRSNATSAEERLWHALRDRRLKGLKFVRQCPIGPFFADFACRELRIIVEVDGGTHSSEDELARDGARATFLEAEGFRIFRARNRDVYDNLEGVLDALLAFIDRTIG